MRSSVLRTSVVTVALAFGLSACSDPDVTRDDLVLMLTERAGQNPGDFPQETAECIADVIFEEGLYTQDELNKGSRNPDEVDGFQDSIDSAIAECGVS